MRVWEKLEQMMVAVTFAEAGEQETAKEILEEKPLREKPQPAVRPAKRHGLHVSSVRI